MKVSHDVGFAHLHALYNIHTPPKLFSISIDSISQNILVNFHL